MNNQTEQQPGSLPEFIYEDVARPPLEEKPPKPSFGSRVINFFKIILAFILTGICVYFILTAPAYYAKAKYYFTQRNQPQEKLIAEGEKKEIVFLPEVQKSVSEIAPAGEVEDRKLTLADLENNYLIIPKINIKVPIIWNSEAEEKTMLENLRKGIVHYRITPLPDSGKGPIFITGHSSYYWWDKGQYKTIFANLDQLEEDDEIALAYNDIVYVYKVFEKKVVRPEQIEVLETVNEPILSLMTCVPLGTNLRRLIVSAKQISPTKTLEETKKIESVPESKKEPSTTPQKPASSDNFYLLPWMP